MTDIMLEHSGVFTTPLGDEYIVLENPLPWTNQDAADQLGCEVSDLKEGIMNTVWVHICDDPRCIDPEHGYNGIFVKDLGVVGRYLDSRSF